MNILYLVDGNADEIEKQTRIQNVQYYQELIEESSPPLILYNFVYFSIISYTQAYKLYSSMAFEARQSGFYTRLCLF